MRKYIFFFLVLFTLHSTQSKEFSDLLIDIQNTPDSLQKSLILDSFINEKKIFPLISDQSCLFLYRGSQTRVILTGDHKNWSANGPIDIISLSFKGYNSFGISWLSFKRTPFAELVSIIAYLNHIKLSIQNG